MANYHVVPRGDAMRHKTSKQDCACGVEVKTVNSDSADGYDVWIYHHSVSIEDAVSGSAAAEPVDA